MGAKGCKGDSKHLVFICILMGYGVFMGFDKDFHTGFVVLLGGL